MRETTAIGAFTPEDARFIKKKAYSGDRIDNALLPHTDRLDKPDHYVVMKEALSAVGICGVADSLENYTRADAAVLMYLDNDDSLDMEEVSAEELYLEVINRSPFFSAEVNDLVMVRWVVKEWAPIAVFNKRLQAVMQEDLFAAVNTKNDPSTGVAKILIKNSAGNLKLTTHEKTIVNRFVNISIDAGTYIKIEFMDGEWQPYAADCPGDSTFASSEDGSSC